MIFRLSLNPPIIVNLGFSITIGFDLLAYSTSNFPGTHRSTTFNPKEKVGFVADSGKALWLGPGFLNTEDEFKSSRTKSINML